MRVICESLWKLLPHFAIIVILKYVIFLNRHPVFCEEFIFIYSLFYFIHYLNSTTRFYTRFLYATPGWNWQKFKQMLTNTLSLNFYYLKIIRILQPCFHPKIIGHILNNKLKTRVSVYMRLYDWSQWKWKRKWKMDHICYDLNRPRSRHEHKYPKYKCVSI